MEFEPGITAVVGPNGSGKSNVADSLRWVLGEQSAKMLRGKKSDDVIFAGSDKKTKLSFAEVIATFNNHDRKIPIDAPEVSIARRVDRSGESEYLINGSRVRLLDIVDLVLRSNIGTSRYTVIGQGTIDHMVLAGPAEIKNLLDEASGVKTYYVKREKTLRRLEQTAQNLMRAEDLLSELEPRLKSLRRQAKRMEARATVEMELKMYQREWFGMQYWQLKNQLALLQTQLELVHQKQITVQGELAQQRSAIDQRQAATQTESSAEQDLQRQVQQLQDQKNNLLEQLSLLRGKMQSQKSGAGSDVGSLRIDLHTTEQRLSENKETLQKLTVTAASTEQQIVALSHNLSTLNHEVVRLQEILAAPSHIDWGRVRDISRGVVTHVGEFLEKARNASDIAIIHQHLPALADHHQKLEGIVEELAHDPEASKLELQKQLQSLLASKDDMTARLQTLTNDKSKALVESDFYQRQIQALEQEKFRLELELKKSAAPTDDQFIATLVSEEVKITHQLEELSQKIAALDSQLQTFREAERRTQQEIVIFERQYRDTLDALNKVKDEETKLQVEQARLQTHFESVQADMHQALGAEISAEVAYKHVVSQTPDLENKINHLKHQLDMIGGVDQLTVQEYQETESRFTLLDGQVSDLKRAIDDLRSVMDELDEHIKTKFNEAFHKINTQFENYFRVLFNGGRAYLTIVKAGQAAEDAAEEAGSDGEVADDQKRPEEKMLEKYEKGNMAIAGVDIKATPPGKKLANIQALSGGERTLTSIALLCSLLSCFPSPFVVLDEVDAALDDANTIRFGQILGTLSHQTQFLTITHNRETMAQANTLYGVTMGDDGISKLLSVKLEQAKAFAK